MIPKCYLFSPLSRVLFELIWRDYFRFLSIKEGNSLFHVGKAKGIAHFTLEKENLLFPAYILGHKLRCSPVELLKCWFIGIPTRISRMQ